jgi:hypothetical protein
MLLGGKWEEVGEAMGSLSSSSCTECIPAVEDWNGEVVPGKVLAIVLAAVCCDGAVTPRVGL